MAKKLTAIDAIHGMIHRKRMNNMVEHLALGIANVAPGIHRYVVKAHHPHNGLTTDTVPAMLTKHEAVLNTNAAALAGKPGIDALNAIGNHLAARGVNLQHYATGTDDVRGTPLPGMMPQPQDHPGLFGSPSLATASSMPPINPVTPSVGTPSVGGGPSPVPPATQQPPLWWQHLRNMATDGPSLAWQHQRNMAQTGPSLEWQHARNALNPQQQPPQFPAISGPLNPSAFTGGVPLASQPWSPAGSVIGGGNVQHYWGGTSDAGGWGDPDFEPTPIPEFTPPPPSTTATGQNPPVSISDIPGGNIPLLPGGGGEGGNTVNPPMPVYGNTGNTPIGGGGLQLINELGYDPSHPYGSSGSGVPTQKAAGLLGNLLGTAAGVFFPPLAIGGAGAKLGGIGGRMFTRWLQQQHFGGGGGGTPSGGGGGYYDPSYLRSIGYEPGQGNGSLWPGAGPGGAPGLNAGDYGVGGGGGSFFHDLAGGRGGPLAGAMSGLGSFGGGSISGGIGGAIAKNMLLHLIKSGQYSGPIYNAPGSSNPQGTKQSTEFAMKSGS